MQLTKRKEKIKKAVKLFIERTNKKEFTLYDFKDFLENSRLGRNLSHLRNCTDRELSSGLIHDSNLRRDYAPRGKTVYSLKE